MQPTVIRKATSADVEHIVSCNRAMARETEARDLDESVIRSGVERLMAVPELGFYLVAEVDGEPVGCAVVTKEWTDWRDGVFWWLKSAYVQPGARRRGVNRAIYQRVRALAEADEDVRALRVYIAKSNTSASIAFRALGFQEIARNCLQASI